MDGLTFSPASSSVLDRAAIGFAVSAAMALLALGPAAARVGPIEVLLALGLLVVSPLAFALVKPSAIGSLGAAMWRVEPAAAAVAIASLVLRRGAASGLFALPWAVLSIAIATPALVQLLVRERSLRLETLLAPCGLAAQALAAVGLVLWRARIAPLDAGGPPAAAIAHLQFIGLGASVIASRLLGSKGRGSALARVAAVAVLAALPLDLAIATGVTWLGAAQSFLLVATMSLLVAGSCQWASAQWSNAVKGIVAAASTLVVFATTTATLEVLADRFGFHGLLAVNSWLRVGAFAAGIFIACDLLAFMIAARPAPERPSPVTT